MEDYSDPNYGSNYFKSIEKYGYLQKYKGVVPQQNGNWGAQIYTNNQRIWLGTFKSEIDAATAYDRASMKLRSSDATRNLPWTKLTMQESKFQSHYNLEAILAMIKDGSYQTKFDEFQRQMNENESDQNNLSPEKRICGYSCRLLFQKELTPSDVGKLNRLVIPKKYAVRYFPSIPEDNEGFANDEVNLTFYDPQNRLWKFRYCYWKSSQSFVFTRGWNLFVKDKKLEDKDKITFYYHENLEMPNLGFWVIDTCLCPRRIGASLKLGMDDGDNDQEEGFIDQKMDDEVIEESNVKTKRIKLFGVEIIQ